MRALVTGNLGYLGPVVVRRLKEQGYLVSGLDLGLFTSQHATMPDWPERQFFADIREGPPRAQFDVIVHLAGLSNDPIGELNPKLTYDINVSGTLALMSWYENARHVIASSCSVYGANDEVANEETTTRPLTSYALAKDLVDQEAPSVAPNVASLRFGTLYGPSPGHRLDLVVNRMTYDAMHGLGITVTGSSWRPLTHVEDAAEAIVRAAEADWTGIRNVVGQNLRMDTLGNIVARLTGAKITVNDSPDKRDYRATTLHPEWMEYRHTVADTIADLAAFSLKLSGIRSRYERLATVKHLVESGRLSPDLKERIAA